MGGGGGSAGGSGGAAGDANGGAGGMPGRDAGGDVADARTVSVIGCADGTREGYTDLQLHPAIAACSGAWSIPGLVAANTLTPQCARQAGNDGALPAGVGCSESVLNRTRPRGRYRKMHALAGSRRTLLPGHGCERIRVRGVGCLAAGG